MDTTELEKLLIFTKQIVHTGKGDLLCGACSLIACEKYPPSLQCLPQAHPTAREQQQSPFEYIYTLGRLAEGLIKYWQKLKAAINQMVKLSFQIVQQGHKRRDPQHSREQRRNHWAKSNIFTGFNSGSCSAVSPEPQDTWIDNRSPNLC